MNGHIGKDASESADSERMRSWNGHMMFTVLCRRQPYMASRLAGHFVAEGAKSFH